MNIRIENLAATDFSDVVVADAAPVALTSPGELLRHEFMEPLGLSANALGAALSVPTNRITGILNGNRAITADTALRLARAFGTSPEFWLNAQASHDMARARVAMHDALDKVQVLLAA